MPLAILGMIALAWQRRPRLQSDRQQQSLVLWGMWLLTMGIFFSVAGFFHQYYMTEMAPAIAALFGIGLVTMWQDYRRSGWRGWLLPLALIATVAEQIYILTSYPTWGQWMIPLMIVLSVLAVGVLMSARIAPRLRVKAPSVRFLLPALGIGVLALMIAPTVWVATPSFGGRKRIPWWRGRARGTVSAGTSRPQVGEMRMPARTLHCFATWRPTRARRNFWLPCPAQIRPTGSALPCLEQHIQAVPSLLSGGWSEHAH